MFGCSSNDSPFRLSISVRNDILPFLYPRIVVTFRFANRTAASLVVARLRWRLNPYLLGKYDSYSLRTSSCWMPRVFTSSARWRPSLKKPVMLYSIGKDSARYDPFGLKAFYPGRPPFPFLHVDTTWKCRELIEFRENYVRKQLGIELYVNIITRDSKLGIDSGGEQRETHRGDGRRSR